MSASATPHPSKKRPRLTAFIDRDACTGCEACVAVCPVDCIVKCYPPGDRSGLMSWCEIDVDRCIACRWCIRLPRKRGEFPLLVCPWDAISMVARDTIDASNDRPKAGASTERSNSEFG